MVGQSDDLGSTKEIGKTSCQFSLCGEDEEAIEHIPDSLFKG